MAIEIGETGLAHRMLLSFFISGTVNSINSAEATTGGKPLCSIKSGSCAATSFSLAGSALDDNALHALGIESSSGEHVKRLAQLAYAAGADGVVCSPLESALVRETLGDDALIVTPGVRPQWAAANDQMRITTPSQALRNGSTHLVIGRPITAANDKAQAILDILE